MVILNRDNSSMQRVENLSSKLRSTAFDSTVRSNRSVLLAEPEAAEGNRPSNQPWQLGGRWGPFLFGLLNCAMRLAARRTSARDWFAKCIIASLVQWLSRANQDGLVECDAGPLANGRMAW
ncbi:hypothetical protein FDECE_7603 [Fusarium decemcellulare]|nr:hypothetical protein FDECE_7603 [Fusarium decemcellulare]